MSGLMGYTSEELEALVHEYVGLGYGKKTAWLERKGITKHHIGVFRAAVFDGDLDRGLYPRKGSRMSFEGHRKLAAARRANQPEDVIARQQEKIERLEAELATQRQVSASLGKAIGLLQQVNEQEPDEDQTPRRTAPARGSESGS